ncbi:hypothetical protein [Lachnoclostridium sp. An169]|uniref:hypothetical protein n=1 Tax=Lachnoclostridium sp. An169 TaxID=1965569 RepID=UPI001122C3E1|nr:hypothetical protein [Lachnoclostridium sp. An169]
MYQIRVKQYNGSVPVTEELWRIGENSGAEDDSRADGNSGKSEKRQIYEVKTAPLQVICEQSGTGYVRKFHICAAALEDLEIPVSLTLENAVEGWDRDNYVFMPAAVYNGNRMESRYIPYPPYCAEKTADGWTAVVTDIPRLAKKEEESRIQFLSGDMSTPASGYYEKKNKKGFLMLAKHEENGRYTGFTVKENKDQAVFSVSSPGVREKNVYFFGDLPDGSGFYPTCGYPSDDEGALLKKGDVLVLEAECHAFEAEDMKRFFMYFNRVREEMEQGGDYCSIPFSRAYQTVKEKCIRMNFSPEGYLMVGTGETIPAHWQSGWVGGGMNTYSYLMEDRGTAREQALSTLRFIVEKLQRDNGWYVPMYAGGQCYGDAFMDTSKPVLLVRKDADLLYFMVKQALYLRAEQTAQRGNGGTEQTPAGTEAGGGVHASENRALLHIVEESILRQADAFVRFFEKHGQLGQFIDMEEEELLVGDTASAAIACGALALAYEYFSGAEENREQGDAGADHKRAEEYQERCAKYLETAEKLGDIYCDGCLRKGVVNGGPGEICQAPDSESAFGLLESCVQLYETTGKKKWLDAAKEAFELAVTWVVSYDFDFPEGSAAAKIGAHTRGTVFANAQNKHSAPGICTLSGNSLLKLYRFTGDQRYLEWMGRISHALSQFVSLPDRPVDTLADKPLPAGFFNERVQMSDWEGKHTVGGFLYGSNWPETTMLLTYVEIPGIYVDLDRDVVQCSDHVKVEVVRDAGESAKGAAGSEAAGGRTGDGTDGRVVLRIANPTEYDAEVTILADHSLTEKKLGHGYFGRMKKVAVPAGAEIRISIGGKGE